MIEYVAQTTTYLRQKLQHSRSGKLGHVGLNITAVWWPTV